MVPSNYSFATWCIMVNASIWCLDIEMIQKDIHFNGENHSFNNILIT